MFCSTCGKSNQDTAQFCVGCGAPLSQQQQPQPQGGQGYSAPQPKKKRSIVKVVLIVLGCLLLLSMCARVFGDKGETQKVNTTATTSQADPCANITIDDWNNASTLWRNSHAECKPEESASSYTVITATSLFKEFNDNEVAANSSYEGRRIAVKGTISKIETDLLGDPQIVFELGNYGLASVVCNFGKGHANDVAKLKKGQSIIINGICTGKTMEMVYLKDCQVSK